MPQGTASRRAAATVGALAETTNIDLSTMSHILRRLEKQELLERRRRESDNRVVLVGLTERGAEVADLCRLASLRHEAVLVEGMSTDEIAALKRALDRAFANARAGF